MLIVKNKPKSIIAESYRVLRTNIQYSSVDKEIKKILITSAEPKEGKTTTAANLALTFAQEEKKVLIIDCDLRKPSVNKKFKVSNKVGLTEILLGEEEFINVVNVSEEYLHILPSGKIPPNPSELLSTKKMEDFLEEVSKLYDIIIIDSPPVNAVTDAQVLSTKVDGTVLVIRALVTKKNKIVIAKENLSKVKCNILGVVLNGGKEKSEDYYYYYGK